MITRCDAGRAHPLLPVDLGVDTHLRIAARALAFVLHSSRPQSLGDEVLQRTPLVTLAVTLIAVAIGVRPPPASADDAVLRTATSIRSHFVDHTSRPTIGRGVVRAVTTPDANATSPPEARSDGVATTLDLLAGAVAALSLAAGYFAIRSRSKRRHAVSEPSGGANLDSGFRAAPGSSVSTRARREGMSPSRRSSLEH